MARLTDRLDFRLTPANRKLIERAAELLGQPLTAFAVSTLLSRAEEVVAQETRRRVSARDWKRFLEVLDDERVASPLARAAKRYRANRK